MNDNAVKENAPMTLREMQLAELGILKVFDSFCRENDLTYSLVGGTLLGAVRHKGFIPWDDDIDVGMPRPDYERFLAILAERNYVLDDNIEIISDRGKNANLPYIKIVDKRIPVPPELHARVDYLWIDILPFDGCPADKKKTKKHLKKAKYYRHIIAYAQSTVSEFNGAWKLIYIPCALYARLYGFKRAIRKLFKLVNKYPFDGSDKVACVAWGLYGEGEVISRDGFCTTEDMQFEDKPFSVMKCWDEYLTGIYGDYMTPRKWSHGMADSQEQKGE